MFYISVLFLCFPCERMWFVTSLHMLGEEHIAKASPLEILKWIYVIYFSLPRCPFPDADPVCPVFPHQAEARAEFAERSVQKLQKEVDRLEGAYRHSQTPHSLHRHSHAHYTSPSHRKVTHTHTTHYLYTPQNLSCPRLSLLRYVTLCNVVTVL